MLHRVLTPQDARWAGADPDYTLSAAHVKQCLHFLRSHYNIVSLEDVLRTCRQGDKLPDRALLISFDDGWADNAEHALPLLRALSLPAVVFMVADAIDRREAFFQERLFSAWRRGQLSTERLAALLDEAGDGQVAPAAPDLHRLRHLVARIERLPATARSRLLEALAASLADVQRHMLDTRELHALLQSGIAIGVHGKTHTPLTQVQDLDTELAGARHRIAEITASAAPGTAAPSALSFPHGRFTAEIAERAHAAGFELLFTSEPSLNPTTGHVAPLLGRLALDTESLADEAGRFRPERLALKLFRAPHRRPV